MKISKSSAIQRQGRAGRVANGYCFKMYKEEEELKFKDTKDPEILRMDISDVILLQTELQGLFQMPCLMYYDQIRHIEEIRREMLRIKAIENTETDSVLTNKGQFIIRSGLDTMVSAFLYECHRHDCGDLGHIASSALKNHKGFFRDNVPESNRRRPSSASTGSLSRTQRTSSGQRATWATWPRSSGSSRSTRDSTRADGGSSRSATGSTTRSCGGS